MKFTKISETAFKEIQLNAGIIVTDFNDSTGEISGDIVGATTGGISFTATPSYTDFGEDIDNCPKNMKELKKLESWEVSLSGTFVTVTADLAKMLVGAADADTTVTHRIIPRNEIEQTDFADIWWVGDYSDENNDTSGGFCAIHLMNALSTGGFQIQTSDKSKGQFAFEFGAHYSMDDQTTVPFTVSVKAGTAE